MIFSVGLVDIDGLYALLDACLLSYYLDVIHCCEDKCEGAVSCNLCSQVDLATFGVTRLVSSEIPPLAI
ncbi:hypothetical protein L208DRAFT_1391247, partial [Tricholoma matsutake]